jgi:hypothetical protein
MIASYRISEDINDEISCILSWFSMRDICPTAKWQPQRGGSVGKDSVPEHDKILVFQTRTDGYL